MSQVRQPHRRYQRGFWSAIAAHVLIMFFLWPLWPQVQSRLLTTVVAWLGRHQLREYQLGMLCGIGVALGAWSLLLATLHWRRWWRGDPEAS